MAKRKILVYPKDKEALRKVSEPVPVHNRRLNRYTKKLIKDLKDTLAERPEGIGLAAPQINVHSRVVVVRLGIGREGDSDHDEKQKEPEPPIALINPKIIEAGREEKDFDGCLSLPGLFADTIRPHYLKVAGIDEYGNPFEHVFEGFDAVLVHHEIDHLNGVLFIDRIETVDDLYRVEEDRDGELVRVPIKLAPE